MPRFVVLEHDHPVLHWDWMLESGSTLRTWRLDAPPVVARVIAASSLPAHRLAYLDYEGPVSGNRGAVQRWDAGTFTWSEDSPARVVVHVTGERIQGLATLEQVEGEIWRFCLTGPSVE